MSSAPFEDFGLTEAAWDALARAELLALDVDGTLTDGRVIYVGEAESQQFCVRDGQGLAWLRQAGVRLAWITGRGSKPTERRAAELGVAVFHPRSGPKDEVLAAVQAELGIAPERTIAMGDDLPDLLLARRAGFFAAPADARDEVLARADWIAPACGGDGAVRALCELVLRARGDWDALLARYGE
ncbi:MAG: HAD family hydrolase [Planctomycetes bacterium]|nr:HAD family hydrolase [Planctomycetota bacterium]MCB9905143.1 HAD family hydrolase [Planctomycetota bacterium]